VEVTVDTSMVTGSPIKSLDVTGTLNGEQSKSGSQTVLSTMVPFTLILQLDLRGDLEVSVLGFSADDALMGAGSGKVSLTGLDEYDLSIVLEPTYTD
jgi:hypothetical protein